MSNVVGINDYVSKAATGLANANEVAVKALTEFKFELSPEALYNIKVAAIVCAVLIVLKGILTK